MAKKLILTWPSYLYLTCSRREDFLMCSEMIDQNNGLLIFTCSSNLQALCNTEIALAVGTFFIAPKQFHQVYTIHGYMNNTYTPLLFAILSDKIQWTYEQILDSVKTKCSDLGYIWQPSTVLLDFEIATHNAFLC